MTNTEMKNTKTATFMDKAKKFVKKHRVELAIGGGLLAAYVLTHKRGSTNGNFQMTVSTLPSPTVVDPETIGTIAEAANDISTAAAPVVETVTEAATEATKVIPEVIPEVEKVVEAVGEVM